jgi:hypothetical protein
MPRKVFTAGEVLAAADVNEFLMDQTVMSFAGTAARGSAIGTAVEGMVSYLEDTNRFEFWNGTAYFPLVAPIVSEDFSAVSSVDIDNVFSAEFKSYKVIFSATFTASTVPLIRFRSGGSTDSGANYSQINITVNTAAALGAARSTGNTSINDAQNSGAGNSKVLTFDIVNAFESSITSVQGLNNQTSIVSAGIFQGVHTVAASQTGISFSAASGTMTGNITIYGYKA